MKDFRLRTKPSSNIKKVLVAAGGALAVLVLMSIFTPSLFDGALNRIASPVWELREDISDSISASVAAVFSSKKQLEEENRRLRQELETARAEVLNKSVIAQENRRLREMLGQQTGGTRSSIVGRVLVHPRVSPYDTLIVDVGREDGVAVGDAVVRGGAVVGEIRTVSSQTARVQLFSSPGTKVEVSLSGENSPQTTATGIGGGNLRITLPRGVEVKQGETILPAEFPRFVIGHVERIEKEPAESFQTIFFRLPVNIYDLQHVSILQSPQQ